MWPPYPGAGQGYWARKSGFSLPVQQQQSSQGYPAPSVQQSRQGDPAPSGLQEQQSPQYPATQFQGYLQQLVGQQQYYVPKTATQQQKQYLATRAQLEPAVPAPLPTAVPLEDIREQQKLLMQKYQVASNLVEEEEVRSRVHPKLQAGQVLYRYNIQDGSLTPVGP